MCKKKRFIMFRLLSFSLALWLFVLSPIGSYASTTSSGSGTNSITISQAVSEMGISFYDICGYVGKKFCSFPDWGECTLADFLAYLEEKGDTSSYYNANVLFQNSAPSGGRGNYTIKSELSQEIVNYINDEYVSKNPLSYQEAYIKTAQLCDVTWFPNYQLYVSFKTWASQQDGYIMTWPRYGNGALQGLDALVIPKTNDINFVGSVSNGSFANVGLYIGWSTSSTPWSFTSDETWTRFNLNGTTTTGDYSTGKLMTTVGNSTRINDGTTSRATIFTNLPKDELVYVFNSLNALKMYNSGSPQSYYLPSGSTQQIGDVSGTVDQFNNAGGYYSSIVDNSVSGMSANDVIKLVDTILKDTGGGSNSDDDDDDDGSSFWTKIGDAIKSLIGGIGEIVSSVVNGVVDLILGEENEDGERSGGLLGLVKDVINGLKDLVDTSFNTFLKSVFDWLPEEIVTCFSAVLILSILFAVINLFRR